MEVQLYVAEKVTSSIRRQFQVRLNRGRQAATIWSDADRQRAIEPLESEIHQVTPSVSNGSNPLEQFRVRVGTGTELWQRFYHMKIPDHWLLGRFPPQNPAFANPAVSLQLII